jgi:signal peptidase
MKITKIIYYLFLVIIAAIALLLIVSVLPITGNIKFMIVQSGSMQPEIKTGSIVMVKPAHSTGSGQADYRVGDIITFGTYSKTKAPTTHRIYEIQEQNGQQVYITKGDANNAPDAKQVTQREIIGKVMFDAPYLGYVVAFTRKPLGFLLILLIPAAVIVSDEVKKIIGEIKKIKNKKSLNPKS